MDFKVDINDPTSYVICRECGEKLTIIHWKHLKESHKMTVDDYKVKYPNLPLISQKFSERRQEQGRKQIFADRGWRASL